MDKASAHSKKEKALKEKTKSKKQSKKQSKTKFKDQKEIMKGTKKMKKNLIRKAGAVVLAMAMILGCSMAAFADTSLGQGGEQGAFTTPDSPMSMSKTIILEKELVVYNADEEEINAPTMSYKYVVAPAAGGSEITDGADKHDPEGSITVLVKDGIGSPAVADGGIVAWEAEELVKAAKDGASNKKDIKIDFSNIAFKGAGIYRYMITETPVGSYEAAGITESEDNSHTRFIDIYVRLAENIPENVTKEELESTPAYWDIYGATCFITNSSMTEETKALNKTTGFVTTSEAEGSKAADSYYTFNVTVSKIVENDAYGATTIAFPFTVLFTNEKVSAGTIVKQGTGTTGTDFDHSQAVDLSKGELKGVAEIKSGQKVKYAGIPMGTDVEVYETNIASGVVYVVDTKVDDAEAVRDESVNWGEKPSAAIAQADDKASFESTKAVLLTEADTKDEQGHTIEVTNTLITISPTGVSLRVAPYIILMAAGIAMLIFARRRREMC